MRHEFCQSARLDSQLNIVLSGFLVVYSFLAKSLGNLNDLVQFTWLPFIQFNCFLFFSDGFNLERFRENLRREIQKGLEDAKKQQQPPPRK